MWKCTLRLDVSGEWSAAAFEPRNLLAFRAHARRGKNYVVRANVGEPHARTIAGLGLRFVSARYLGAELGVLG